MLPGAAETDLLSSRKAQGLEEPGSSEHPEVEGRLPFEGLVDYCSEEHLVNQGSFHSGHRQDETLPTLIRRPYRVLIKGSFP